MDPQTQTAPPVVAVVVTCDAGSWLEPCLQSLAEQDYPNLSVLVIDAGSLTDPTARVAAVLPSAFVRRLPARTGYAAAANDVLGVVEGASLYLFCHDDVALDPNALRVMVEELFRSNAGIVAPKLVEWERPERLLQVGMGADKFGAPMGSVERGELDQAQHDGVRDVSFAPGGCTLVRADLFTTLDGFDGAIEMFGEDLDLSWRAQLAGARVVVAPAARVRHLEAAASGRRALAGRQPDASEARDQVRRLQLRHRLRTVLKLYSRTHLLRVLPQLLALQMLEVLYGLVAGRTRTVRAIGSAWRWNLAHVRDLRVARGQARKARQEGDAAIAKLQVPGSARLTAFLRGQLAGEDRARLLAGEDRVVDSLRQVRLPLLVWGLVALALLVGSRHLLFGPLANIGELAPIPGPGSLLRQLVSGWRLSGLGSESPAPPAFGVLGIAGALLLGGTGLLLKILVLGALPVGVVGAHRLARPLGSMPARLVAVVVYAANPLPYDALARGRWGGLLSYAAAPWLLAAAGRLGGLPPFAAPIGWRRAVLGLGLGFGVLGALAPALLIAGLLIFVAMVLGSVVAGGAGGALRALGAAVISFVIAVVLLFPWSLDAFLPGARWSTIVGVESGGAASGLGSLLRFDVGPMPTGPLGWAFLAAALLPLLIGRDWRLAWAIRSWVVALSTIGLAWAAGRGWLPVALPAREVLLAPAAAALALSAALGLRAFELDLPRYRFGWRQAASLVSAAGVVLACLPVLVSLPGGRWRQPDHDLGDRLSFLPDAGEVGAYRVLWLGDPASLPLQGWELAPGVGYATSRDGLPTMSDSWPPSSDAASELLADALRLARAGDTSRLGHLLAPMAVRFLVVAHRVAPASEGTPVQPLPADLTESLADQVDLRPVVGDAALTVYENVAWGPGRAQLSGAAVEASLGRGFASALRADLAGNPPVLTSRRGPFRFAGSVGSGAVLHAEAASGRWQLEVDGRSASGRRAFGWATAYNAPAAGDGVLRYRTSLYRYVALALELVLWVVAVRVYRRSDDREVDA